MASESHSSHTAGGHGHGHDDGAVHVHISSTQFYVGIFLALVCLTILTVKVSYYDFGSANILIAMAIATMKASLVAVFFMHLAHDKKFNAITFVSAFVFLGVFIVFTYDDLGSPRRGRQRLRRDGRPADGPRGTRRAAGDDRDDRRRRRGRAAEGRQGAQGQRQERVSVTPIRESSGERENRERRRRGEESSESPLLLPSL